MFFFFSDTEGVWKDRLRSQMQQPPEFPLIVQQHPAGPQVLQQHLAAPQSMQQQSPAGPLNVPQQPTEPQSMQQQSPAGPLNVPQQPTGPKAMQQLCRAGPQAMQLQRPTCPQAMQQPRPAGPSYTPEEVIELQRIHRNNPMLLFTLLLRQPAPSQQAIESREMAQRQKADKKQGCPTERPFAPQHQPALPATANHLRDQRVYQPNPSVSRTQDYQVPRLGAQGGAIRRPSRKAADEEETICREILLSANHFDVNTKQKFMYH